MSTPRSCAISSSTGAVKTPSASPPGSRPASRPRPSAMPKREVARLRARAGQQQVAEPGKAHHRLRPARRRPCRSASARRSRAWSAPPRRWRRGRARRRCRRRWRARSWRRRRSRRRARRWNDRAGSVAEPIACASAAASSSSAAASVTAVGSPRATSAAKLGPDRIAGAAPGAHSAMISFMNFLVPRSMPLAQTMTGVPAAESGASAVRDLDAPSVPAQRAAAHGRARPRRDRRRARWSRRAARPAERGSRAPSPGARR